MFVHILLHPCFYATLLLVFRPDFFGIFRPNSVDFCARFTPAKRRDFFVDSARNIHNFAPRMRRLSFFGRFGIFAVLLTFAFSTFAFDSVRVEIERRGAKPTSTTHKLAKRSDGALRFVMPKGEIPKDAAAVSVFSPISAKTGGAGYWLTPDGVYGKFTQTGGKYTCNKPVMPIFAISTDSGAAAAVVKGLKYEFLPTVSVRNGTYEICARFDISDIGFAPYEDIIVDFYPLPSNATFVDVGKLYRRLQLESGTVRPLAERAKDNKFLAYSAKSLFVKLSMACKNNKLKVHHQTRATEPELGVYCTFDESVELMKYLKSSGLDNVEFCFTGWNRMGHDGRFPEVFPVEPALGGEEKMRRAVAYGQSIGYQMTCHLNYTDAYTIADCWDEEYICKNPNGTPQAKHVWAGGLAFQPCYKRVLELFIEDHYSRLRQIGIAGLFHLDVNSAIRPCRCCDPRHPQTRAQSAESLNKLQRRSREVFGGQGSECGFDHVAPTLDFALYTSGFHTWRPRSPLVSGYCHLWEVVYHGIIINNPFAKTMRYMLLPDESEYARWRVACAAVAGRPVVYSSCDTIKKYTPRLARAAADYAEMSYLQYEFIEDLRDIADGVKSTTFSDGSEIVSNFTDKPFAYRGKKIPPLDFLLFKPTKK